MCHMSRAVNGWKLNGSIQSLQWKGISRMYALGNSSLSSHQSFRLHHHLSFFIYIIIFTQGWSCIALLDFHNGCV